MGSCSHAFGRCCQCAKPWHPATGDGPGLVAALDRRGALPSLQPQPGGVLVLYWWASWCPVCVKQSPLMQALHQAQSGTDLRVLGVSVDKNMAAAQTHLDKNGYSFPSVLWASGALPDVVPPAWVPKAVPTVWVYDRGQRLVQAHTGLMSAEAVQKLTGWL